MGGIPTHLVRFFLRTIGIKVLKKQKQKNKKKTITHQNLLFQNSSGNFKMPNVLAASYSDSIAISLSLLLYAFAEY